jgi:patatin-like phospholipase/acyl hydrolase
MHESGSQALLAPAQRPHHPNLGSDLLRTGLAIVAKRIDTSSLWVMTNNPRSKYWDRESEHWKDYFASQGGTFHPNRDYSLRAIVQASASAPFYLEPVEVEISPGQTGLFLDGGVSTCNNPSLELFYMATLKAFGDGGNGKGISPYAFDWKTGADNLYLLSVGTGTWRETEVTKKLKNRPPIIGAINALTSIMSDSDHNAVAVMQAISETPGSRFFVNSNVGDMRGLRMVSEPLLTYKRVTPLLTSDWLATSLAPGFAIKDRKLRYLREFDNANAKNLDLLQRIGAASGAQLIEDTDLPPSFDLPEWKRAVAA